MSDYPAWSCDALIDVLRRKVSFGGASSPAASDEDLRDTLDLLGRLWPLPDSAWDPLMKVTGHNDVANLKEYVKPWTLVKQMLADRGRPAFAMSHGASVERGIDGLGEDRWTKAYRSEFGRLCLEMLAGMAVPDCSKYRDLPLTVLVVDNQPPEQLFEFDDLLPPHLGLLFWKKATWWTLKPDKEGKPDVQAFEECLHHGDPTDCFMRWSPSGGTSDANRLRLRDVDIVIQDQFLGSDGDAAKNGDKLAELYYTKVPQALVFLTTGVSVESIVSLGANHYIDRVIPKKHLAALPWYYYLAFTDVMGSMLWEPWLYAESSQHFFEERDNLRHLLRSIRRWRREPEILWHGQALAEMVDHGNQHISDLWRLTNEIIGARKEDQQLAIPLETVSAAERVLLALGVWLHDMGHRGDEFSLDPASIRDLHGSISEKLLLQRPEAFGLEWLLTSEDPGNGDERVSQRNKLLNNGQLSPIRLVGLVCRHHQSSAPLFADSLAGLHYGLKFPSDYARMAWSRPDVRCKAAVIQAISLESRTSPEEHRQTTPADVPDTVEVEVQECMDVIEDWRSDADLHWVAHDVRVLEDFDTAYQHPRLKLMKTVCLLRLCDALHRSSVRAGSEARERTHQLYRKNRIRWVRKRRREVQDLMHATPIGAKPYLALLQELLSLEFYRDLLRIQDVHLWRQAVVDRVSAKYSESQGREAVVVTYQLSVSETVFRDEDLNEFLSALVDDYRKKGKTIVSEVDIWWENFIDDAVESELKSQRGGRTQRLLAASVFNGVDLVFRTQPGAKDSSLRSISDYIESQQQRKTGTRV